MGHWQDEGPPTHTFKQDGVELEVMFIALDRPDDLRKLLSLELTGAWINEAREIPKAILDGLTARVGRFPPATLLLVGAGSEEERIRRLAFDMGLHDRVIFTGVGPSSGFTMSAENSAWAHCSWNSRLVNCGPKTFLASGTEEVFLRPPLRLVTATASM